MHSALGSGNLDETENPDDDEDDGNSSSTPADGKEPEVKAPLHSTALNQTPAALMRVQAATAGLQNVLESAPAEEHGAGLRYDSLTDQPGPSSAKKRPLSDMQSSVNDEADLQDTHKTKSSRKKVRRHPANTDFATMSNKNMDENMDEDDNFDADMALLQRATNCEEDNAFVDDDDYDALDAISDSDPNEARDMTLLETLNIKKALADDPDSDLDSNFTTPKGPPTFDSVFDDFYRVPEFGDPTDPPLLSQQDDFLPDFSARPHRRNASDGSGRKVRFEDEVQISSQSSSTGSSEIRSEFPDILLAQDSLDAPPFPRGSIAAHRQLSPNGSDDSYWDVTDGYFQPDNVQVSEPSESSPGSSGYECMLEIILQFLSLIDLSSSRAFGYFRRRDYRRGAFCAHNHQPTTITPSPGFKSFTRAAKTCESIHRTTSGPEKRRLYWTVSTSTSASWNFPLENSSALGSHSLGGHENTHV